MLMDRIMGALMFKRETYAEVEQDSSFTQTAWMVAAVSSAVGALGSFFAYDGIFNALIGVIATALFSVLGMAIGAWVISFIGKQLFQADVSFEEMVRVLGLASVWQALNIFGIIPLLGLIVVFVAAIAGLVAYFVAVNEALDLELAQTIITVVLGWLASAIIGGLAGSVLAIVGIGAGAATGLLGG